MKNFFKALIIGVFASFTSLYAQETYTVDLSGNGDFDTIHEAVVGASSGDTLLIQSDQFLFTSDLGKITIDKPLVIIGTGFQTVENGGTELRDASGVGFFNIESSADGTVIKGLRFIQLLESFDANAIDIDEGANSVVIAENVFASNNRSNYPTITVRGEEALIRNNIFRKTPWAVYVFDTGTNAHIANNIFSGQSDTDERIYTDGYIGVKISNNMFLEVPSIAIRFDGSNPEVYSNVFLKNSSTLLFQVSSSSTPVISNNGYFENDDDEESSYGLDTSPVLSDPLFSDVDIDNAIFTLDYFDAGNFDFALQESSPYINAGRAGADYNDTDGSRNDIGIFGGPYPFTNIMGGSTKPVITTYEVSPAVVSPTGSITIQLNGKIGSEN